MKRIRIRPRVITVVLIAATGMGYPTYRGIARFDRERIHEETILTLHPVAEAVIAYAEDAPGGRYPRLSTVPGRLMFQPSGLYPQYLADPTALISPAHPDRQELLQRAAADPESAFDDHSYWYLGYAVANPRSMKAFIEAYKDFLESGEPIPDVDELWPEYSEDEKRKREQIEAIDRNAGTAEFSHAEARRLRAILMESPSDHAIHRRYSLRIGIERFFYFDHAKSEADSYFEHNSPRFPAIPILIERPELHGDGGHVLYSDGYVEFLEYPGSFPMTEAFIGALRELDALGTR